MTTPRFLLALTLLVASLPLAHGTDVLAYYTTDDGKSAKALKARHAYFNQFAADCFAIDRNGKTKGEIPSADLAFAQAQKMETFATCSNYAGSDFNPGIAHALITTPAATKTFIDTMTKILAAGKFTGINLDFESIPNKDRAAYSAFVKTVADQMRKGRYRTIVSVPAAQMDEPDNSWTGAFDYKALGAAADMLQLMTYDENGSWGKDGPVAGLDWVEATIKFALANVPANKLNMGVPAFAFDWDLDDAKKNKQIEWVDIAPLLAKTHGEVHWDEASSSPNFTYKKDGHRHIVWHESPRSLALKAALVGKYKLAGLSVWELGQEDESFWQALSPLSH